MGEIARLVERCLRLIDLLLGEIGDLGRHFDRRCLDDFQFLAHVTPLLVGRPARAAK
jgi:hypothetical protein